MNDFAPRYTDHPRPGYFKLRAWRRGPWKPARIYRPIPFEPGTLHICDRWPALVGEIDGVLVNDYKIDGIESPGVDKVWEWGKEITEEEWTWISKITWPIDQRLPNPNHG
jgi:hypothetical protein